MSAGLRMHATDDECGCKWAGRACERTCGCEPGCEQRSGSVGEYRRLSLTASTSLSEGGCECECGSGCGCVAVVSAALCVPGHR